MSRAAFGDDYQSWDQVELGGVVLPGKATVKPKLARKLDKKSAADQDGGTLKDKGYLPAKITIKVVWWLPEHEEAWKEIIPIIHPRTAPDSREPLPIANAATAFWGIYRVYVESIEGPESSSSTPGTRELTIECVEWAPEPSGRAANARGKGMSDAEFDEFMNAPRTRPSVAEVSPTPR